MIDFSISQLKLVLQKNLRRSIYIMEPHISVVRHYFSVGNSESYTLQWNFELLELNAAVSLDSIKNPIFYGDIWVKVKSINPVHTNLYRIYLRNDIIDGIDSNLDYVYRGVGGPWFFDYFSSGTISNPLPGDHRQDNITPFNSSNFVFTNQLNFVVFTDVTGTFEVDVDVIFKGYKIYFR